MSCNLLRMVVQQCRERPNFLNCILFTDETGYTRSAVFNSHNTHIYFDENSHPRQEVRFQRRFSINVCGGIINDRLVGPKRLNAAQYREFLNNVLEEQLDVEVPLGERVRMWYLHDGAPPHFAKPVTEWLNNHFLNHWVGRNGPVALASMFTRSQSV